MLAYILRRLLWTPILLLLAAFFVFFMGTVAPGDPAELQLKNRATPHGRAANRSFRGVVVHRDLRIVDEQRQARTMIEQTPKRFAARLAQLWLSQLVGRLSVHRIDRLAQSRVASGELGRLGIVR